MKLFQVLQRYMKFIGFQRPQSNDANKFNARCVAILLYIAMFIVSGTAFIIFDANTFQEYSGCFFAWITGSLVFIGYFIFTLRCADIFNIIQSFETIVENQFDDPVSKFLYEKANKTIEHSTQKLHTIFVKCVIPFGAIPSVMQSYYAYFVVDLGSEAFFMPTFMKFPFDWKTPMGFAVALSLQTIALAIINLLSVCAIGLLIGFFNMMTSFALNIQMNFRNLNELHGDTQNDSIKKELGHIICFHSQVKKLSNFVRTAILYGPKLSDDFNYAVEFNINSYYVWSILAICDTLLMCHNAEGWSDLLFPASLVFTAFAQIFVLCEVGERITSQFVKINNGIFFCDWYRFPADVRKILPTILMGTQEPVMLSGFGNVRCTRETFSNVSKTGFSYFTMLQQF